jgi:hypothetical protein
MCRAQQLQHRRRCEAHDPTAGRREVEQIGPGWDPGFGCREEGAAGGAFKVRVCEDARDGIEPRERGRVES